MIVRRTIKLVGVATAVVALGINLPGQAAADERDDAFSQKLFDDAINFAGQQLAVKRAAETCAAFDAGMSPAEVHDAVMNGTAHSEGSAFSPQQAAIFMADAVQFYCPGYANLFVGH
ncbi:DUF732 domain-containing protein [Mycobacterium sp. IDR2000157661]|uniref:DUF732 domain-containing protein n=1 Tax=Mycobacterium sp. IDR2000157661 TaxID=2867005 RepID=UPI001EEC5209|nr:DUF732 domain-containing protein [Mycobacterium sp. IDR2000157661]ULE31799.1 DUF732 domain-containing protein [Mycobacterium sp. IDR2000157661]